MTIDYHALIRAYVETHNNHDLERSLAFLTEDVRLEATGRGEVVGLEEASRGAAWDAALQSQMRVADLETRGRHVFCTLEERNEWLRLAGIDHITYPGSRFTFHGRLICHIRTRMSEESSRLLDEVFPAIMTWAVRERPVDIGRLLPAGEMHYGPRAARGWLALLADWREATGGR